MKITDILILACLQTLWAATPTVIKVCLREMNAETIIILRYGIAALVLLAVLVLRQQFCRLKSKDWFWVSLIGIIVYIASPLLALRGIQLSQALDIGILVSLEPLATAILAYLLLKEVLNRQQRLAIFLAVPGVMLLSGVHEAQVGTLTTGRMLGNLLFIASLFCEGSHTVIGKKLSNRYSPLVLSAYSFFIGCIIFASFNITQVVEITQQQYSWKAWAGVIYLGAICSALGYTVWFYLLKRLRANTIALSLYLQAVVGALLGHFVLAERLPAIAWLGALLILSAVTLGFYKGGNKI